MDAFVIRRCRTTPSPQAAAAPLGGAVFADGRFVLVPDAAPASAEVRAIIEAHGGCILEKTATTAPAAAKEVTAPVVFVVVSEDATPHLPEHAPAVSAAWVHECIARRQRVPVDAFLWSPAADEPSPKRPRVAPPPPRAAATAVAAAAPMTTTTTTLPTPVLRPWRVVGEGGSLHVLDARGTVPDSADVDADPTSSSGKRKIAAFDLDGTLIVTKSGKRFAQHADDWKLFHPTAVRATLEELARKGFVLAIISNQNGVAKGKATATEVQRKLEAVIRRLQVPMLALFATQDDVMRKPRPGAWDWLVDHLGGPESVDAGASLYCGDAAGRPKVPGRSKDFAATDYKFALNVGAAFHTPEALFLGSTQRIHTRPELWDIGYDPRACLAAPADSTATQMLRPEQSTQELVLLVGPPASGKSHLASRHFADYAVVCQDELKTPARCRAACAEALAAGKSVVIDNTNRDPRTRREWIALAESHGIGVRCLVLDVPRPLVFHLNAFRQLTSAKHIPDIAIHSFFKSYVAPQASEGFGAIVRVGFCPDAAALPPAHRRLLGAFL